MYGKSPKNKQLKATVWFELLTFELFLWCEFPGYVKDAREKELFVMQIGIFFLICMLMVLKNSGGETDHGDKIILFPYNVN